MEKRRLDTLLAERGLFPSRSRAAASVMAGEVRVGDGGRRAEKPGELVDVQAPLIIDERPAFVSRGGIKLDNALSASGLSVTGRRALDVGASTGGFTDCLLQRGGARGDRGRRGLRHARLSPAHRPARAGHGEDERARAGARAARRRGAARPRHGRRVVHLAGEGARPGARLPGASGYDVLALVKPQFELGRGKVGKGGVVRDAGDRRAVLVAVGEAAGRWARACAPITPRSCRGRRATARRSCG